MQADVRRKLTMAARALSFTNANPPSDASHIAVVTRLEERLLRADTLALQERQGRINARTAVAGRRALRRQMQQGMARHIVRTAEFAAKSGPMLEGDFQLPSLNGPYRTFHTAMRSLLTAATANRDRLIQSGLGETLLEDLGTLLTEFERESTTVFIGRSTHIGASAELKSVTEDAVDLVGLLDGIHRARFANDAEKLAAWEAARDVATTFARRRPDEPVTPPIDGAEVVPPVVGGELREAA
jgi:hypothetical protein